jgi:hypothetical protein
MCSAEATIAKNFLTTAAPGCSRRHFFRPLLCGWLLHAYVIMRNHYHLAVETPEGNLVEGMPVVAGHVRHPLPRLARGSAAMCFGLARTDPPLTTNPTLAPSRDGGFGPSLAKAMAVARPIPDVPPVPRETFR